MTKIIIDGTKILNNVGYLILKTDDGHSKIEVPIDKVALSRIELYMKAISATEPKPVERVNEETSD